MTPSGSIYRPALALVAMVTITTFGAGLTGCGQTLERCVSEASSGDCTDPGDFTMALSGSLVLAVDRWPDASKVSQRDGSGSRWEYSVTVDEVLYRSPTVDHVATGTATLVMPVSAAGGSPSWNTEVSGPVYVVADRALGSSGPVEDEDLVVKGVFDKSLNVIGSPRKTTNLQGFVQWLRDDGRSDDPPSTFLEDWVRSLNEEIRPDGSHPMQDLWNEYESPTPDPDENDPSTVAPEVQPDDGPAEADDTRPVVTTPSPPATTPGG